MFIRSLVHSPTFFKLALQEKNQIDQTNSILSFVFILLLERTFKQSVSFTLKSYSKYLLWLFSHFVNIFLFPSLSLQTLQDEFSKLFVVPKYGQQWSSEFVRFHSSFKQYFVKCSKNHSKWSVFLLLFFLFLIVINCSCLLSFKLTVNIMQKMVNQLGTSADNEQMRMMLCVIYYFSLLILFKIF